MINIPAEIREQIVYVARSHAPVLVTGETGTGKELAAREIHARSGRAGLFVAVNCGALTPALLETELEAAEGGTLFLDEICDLPAAPQVKLLRALQEREVVRGRSRKRLDLRIVTATNMDVADAVGTGRFRLDLYYRLNVFPIRLPPLRERRADILPLTHQFLLEHAARLRMTPPNISIEAQRVLENYAWPGNVRELENVVQAAMLVSRETPIRPSHLRFAPTPSHNPGTAPRLTPLDALALQLDRLMAEPPESLLNIVEELIVRRAFSRCDNNQVQTARLLGISRHTLRTLLKRVGLLDGAAEPTLRRTTRAQKL
jgi:sigma-54-specific transcriptional regulator